MTGRSQEGVTECCGSRSAPQHDRCQGLVLCQLVCVRACMRAAAAMAPSTSSPPHPPPKGARPPGRPTCRRGSTTSRNLRVVTLAGSNSSAFSAVAMALCVCVRWWQRARAGGGWVGGGLRGERQSNLPVRAHAPCRHIPALWVPALYLPACRVLCCVVLCPCLLSSTTCPPLPNPGAHAGTPNPPPPPHTPGPGPAPDAPQVEQQHILLDGDGGGGLGEVNGGVNTAQVARLQAVLAQQVAPPHVEASRLGRRV